MKTVHAILLVGVLAALVCGCGASPSTRIADNPLANKVVGPLLEAQGFSVLDFRVRRDEYDRVSVIGEVKNTGYMARSVELQATLRNEDDRVAAVGHFYPASQTNIEPGETWPFAYSFGRQDEAVKAELRIIGAVRAMEVLNVAYEMR